MNGKSEEVSNTVKGGAYMAAPLEALKLNELRARMVMSHTIVYHSSPQPLESAYAEIKVSEVTTVEMNTESGYPSLNEIKEDFQTLRLIAPAYAGREGELTAALQYVFQAIVLGEQGNQTASEKILKIAVTEMHHLEILGTMITKLGAPPIFTSCPPYPVGYYSAANVNYVRTPRQMLCADICAEENAISQYERILCRLKNPPVAAVIARILEDEKLHLKVFNQLLSEL